MVADRDPLVYGGVFGIVLGSVLALGVFLDQGKSEAQTQSPTHGVDDYVDRPAVNVDIPAEQDPTIYLDEVVIKTTLPSHLATKVQKPKVWVCGEMGENLVGGRNRNCEWK